ncbi:class I SAM-dependent methyltransferase [Rhizobium mayense]|uniref:Methyltransferase n=1 Tax=Rhizobium mayense TaxID=1312184 RepID=A0ABT7JZ12_9HYPH|nr:methyltransferase [Rhizobium mayense]MDL2401501.1 methyltransferase [Rhizobium mayense]
MSSTAAEAGMGEISPNLIVDAMFACRKTAAIKAAIELDLFTLIGDGGTAKSLAVATNAAERGIRILCDFLVVNGFLTKTGHQYALTPSSRAFLDRHSPAYMGSAIEFLAAPEILKQILDDPTSYVRNGGSIGLANMSPDNPVWVKFARGMGSFTGGSAVSLAAEMANLPVPPKKILDIAAGHGRFGIEMAKTFPSAEIVAVDWNSVLQLAKHNAWEFGVSERYKAIPGSAFDVDWGTDYDLILLPNFLHHFDMETCAGLLVKTRASLSRDGRVVAVEFVPNEDLVSPPFAAAFSWEMLANTPKGEAYTQKDLAEMARRAGFQDARVKPLPPSPASVIFFE